MQSINTVEISDDEVRKVLLITEGHYADKKAIEIAPAKGKWGRFPFSPSKAALP